MVRSAVVGATRAPLIAPSSTDSVRNWSAMCRVGAGGVMGNEVDGGILGGVLVLEYAGLLVWIIGSSVVMLCRPALVRTASAASLG